MKKRLLKNAVAILSLLAMLTQNAYTAYAAMEGTVVYEQEETAEETVEGTEVIAVDGDVQDSGEEPTSDVNYDDQVMPINEEYAEEVTEVPTEEPVVEIVEEAEEVVDANVDIMATQISGSGLDYIDIYVDTTRLSTKDSFRIQFTGAAEARYNTKINDLLDVTSGGTYTFESLNKEGFNIRATSDDDVDFEYASENGTPVIRVISNKKNDNEKKLSTTVITLNDGTPVTAVTGTGYENVTIDFDTDEIQENSEFTFYIDTNAAISVNGNEYTGKIGGLTKDSKTLNIDGLFGEEFTAYAVSESEAIINSEVEIVDSAEGRVLYVISEDELRTRTVYKYEDEKVLVTATLTDPAAVPDDAIFKVTEITAQSAVDAYIEALDNADETAEYTADNTLLYDIAFLVKKTDEDGNVISDELVEFEPEVGSVTIDIKFKKSQITDEIGAVIEEDVVINHLPLKEIVKESVDTTVEATNISASDIIVEPVNAEVSVVEGGADTVVLSLDNLSVVALTVLNPNVSVAKTTDFDLATSLGDANNYGVITNYYEQTGDTESNCYAALYKGTAQDLGASSNYSNAGGDNYIGDFAEGCALPIRFHQQPRYVYLGDAAWNKAYLGTNKSAKKATADEISGAYFDKAKCASTEFMHVQKNVSTTLSSINTYYAKYASLKDANNRAPEFHTVTKDNGAKLGATDVNLSGKGAGLFVTNYAGGDLSTDGEGWMNLTIDPNSQTLLINVNPNSDTFNLGYYTINGNTVNGLIASKDLASDKAATSVIFDFGNYSGTINIKEIAAVIIAPKATVHTGSTCAGIVACDKLESVGGEWHYHNHNLPSPGSYTFKATKKFANDRWPENGKIQLKLEPLDSTNCGTGNWVSAKAPMPNGATGPIIIEVTKENPVADFGTVTYPYDCPSGHRQDWVGKDGTQYTRCYMYKITEINTGIPGVWYDNHYQIIKVWVNQKKAADGITRVAIDVNGSTREGICEGTLGPIEFNNTYNPAKGEIVIKKAIEGKGLSVGPYYFEVQLNDGKSYPRLTQNQGLDNSFNKVHTFALNAGETFTFTNVPAGEYSVVEYKTQEGWISKENPNTVPTEDSALGFKVVYTDGQNISITGNSRVTKVITNVSTYGDAEVEVNGKKELSPDKYGIEANKYEFEIRPARATDGVSVESYNAGAPLPAPASTKNYNTAGDFKFNKIKYDADHIGKTYKYIVSEKSGAISGMVYDGSKYLVTVAVTQVNGKVQATKTVEKIGDSTKTSIVFANNLQAYGETSFEAKKTLQTKNFNAGDFTFKLESGDANGGSRTTLKTATNKDANGYVDFAGYKATYTHNNIGDTFYYYITEVEPDGAVDHKKNGITYSQEEYRYVVTVGKPADDAELTVDKEAVLPLTISKQKKNSDGTWAAYTGVPEFTNIYNSTGEALISVKKNTIETSGTSKLAELTYTVKVTEADSNWQKKTGDGVYSSQKEIVGPSTATFDKLTFASAGTYNYIVEEVLPSGVDATHPTKDGITYDTTQHKVQLVIEDNGTGGLTVAEQYNDTHKVNVNTAIDINNSYNVTAITTYIEGEKTLVNKNLEDGEFSFTITGKNSNSTATLSGVTTTVTNGVTDAEGRLDVSKIKFGPITYTTPGVYTYEVKEVTGDEENIAYDDAAYEVTVTVTDNGVGGLSVAKSYKKNNSSATAVSFSNTYQPNGTATIEAEKILNSDVRTTANTTFTFKLLDSGKNVIDTKTTDANGKVAFKQLDYTYADLAGENSKDFYYYICEEVPSPIPDGWTYDSKDHRVKVTLEKVRSEGSSKDSLKATVTYEDGNTFTPEVTKFVNTYSATGTAKIDGVKEMIGRKIKDGERITIKLEPKTPGDTNLPQTAQVVRNSDKFTGKFSFEGLTYTKPGDYVYEVTETAGEDSNVQYDGTKYTVTVHVTDPTIEDKTKWGKLETSVESDVKPIKFTNRCEASNVFNPIASKELFANGTTRTLPLGNKKFNFNITEVGGTLNETKSNDGNGSVAFSQITYTEAGEHTYIITETSTSDDSYTCNFEEVSYKIVVKLTESETETLDKEVKYYRKDKNSDYTLMDTSETNPVVFKNYYTANGSIEIPAVKELKDSKGNAVALRAGEFSFELVDENGVVVQTATNDKEGNIKFTRTYTQADLTGEKDSDGKYVKVYTIREVRDDNKTYYGYSNAQYKAYVTLQDNGSGSIRTDCKILDAQDAPVKTNAFAQWIADILGRNNVTAKFINTYDAYGKVVLYGRKELRGKTLVADMFHFELKEGNSVLQTVGNNADGTITFAAIPYTINDVNTTHTYTVTEKHEDLAGVEYSTFMYTATVTVKDDNRDGVLEVDTKISGSATISDVKTIEVIDGENYGVSTAGPLSFINAYVPTGTEIVIGGEKKILGIPEADLSKYKDYFSFTMSNKNDTKAYTSTKTNGADGKFVFDKIVFSQEDLAIRNDGVVTGYLPEKEFNYTIVENATNKKPGFDYDSNLSRDIIIVLKDNGDGTLSASVKGGLDPLAVTTFTNTKVANGKFFISVEKTVDGSSATDKPFTFKAECSDGTTSSVTVKNGETKEFPEYSFTLEDVKAANGRLEKTYTISEDVPEGAVDRKKDGYTYSSEVHTVDVVVTQDGSTLKIDKTVDGVATDNANVSFTYENIYNAEGTTTLLGHKELIGRTLNADEFKFGLFTDAACSEAPIAVTSNDAAGNFSFNLESVLGRKFNEGEIGQKTYYIKELTHADDENIVDVAHVTYDPKVYTVVVTIADKADGTLICTPVYKNGDATYGKASFTNDFTDSKTVTFRAKKELIGKTLKAGQFTFKLHEVAGDKMSEDETIGNTDGGDVIFNTELTFNQNDVGNDFRYEITEVAGSNSNYKYSTAKYYAKVDVSIENGELKAVRKYYEDKACTKEIVNPENIKFVNEYKSNTKVDIGGKKFLVGFDNVADKGEYTFELKDRDSGRVLQTKTVKGAGTFAYDSILYDEDDLGSTFVYTVSEVKGNVPHVTYSDVVVTITVHITTDANDNLVAEKTVLNAPAADKLAFTNIYSADGEMPITGLKSMTGKNLESGKYTFTLSDEEGNVFTKVQNVGNTFTIAPDPKTADGKKGRYLSYNQDDIGKSYVYKVAESLSSDGSTKDDTVYTVTDTIGKDDANNITISRVITKPDGTTVDGSIKVDTIEFVNTYEAHGEIQLAGKKRLVGKDLEAGMFEFVLKDSGNNEVDRVANSAAKAGEDAVFTFNKLEYDQECLAVLDDNGNKSYAEEKTFYYTVSEEGTQEGVTNDTNIYTIAVTVKHNVDADGVSDGTLTVTKVVTSNVPENEDASKSLFERLKDRIAAVFGGNSDDMDDVEIQFVNNYGAEGHWDPRGNKELTGRKFAAGEFDFKISEIESLSELSGDEISLSKEMSGKSSAVANNADGTVVFDYTKVDFLTYKLEDCGTHYYRVEEIEPDSSDAMLGVAYDKTIFEYEVEVKDVGNGTIDATTKKMNVVDRVKKTISPTVDSTKFRFTFNNKYEATGYIDLPATKVMIGRDLGNDKYNFTIVDDATQTKKTVQNDGNAILFKHDGENAVEFLNYTVDDIGTYTYTIYEEDTTDVVKDPNVYRVTVVVANKTDSTGKPVYDGSLDARISKVEKKLPNSENYSIYTKYDSESLFTFENKYEAKAEIDFAGLKNLIKYKGGARVLDPNEYNQKFSFTLYQYDNDARTVGKRTLATANCNGNGEYKLVGPKYTQDDLLNSDGKTYGKEKIYHYQIVEVTPSQGMMNLEGKFVGNDGVTYDNTVYNVDVKVMPSGNNKLNLEVKKINPDGTANIMNPDMTGTTYSLGGFDYTNIKPEYTEIYGKKHWNDGITDPTKHPDVTIRLHQIIKGVDTEIDKVTIVAPAIEYKFTNLPVVTDEGTPIKYEVTEDPIPGYTSEKVGYDFYNTKGDVIIRKIDARTGAPLEGAVLAILDGTGKEVERWTSGTSAHKVEAILDAGVTYTLHEVSAPRGYMVAVDQTFTVPAKGGEIVVTMEDPQIRGNVRLLKLDASTRERLSGAEFALYTESGSRVFASTSGGAGSYRYSETASNGRFIVSPTGELSITDLPYGTYYFVETVAPVGYEINPDRIAFTVLDNDATYEVTCLDPKASGSVRLVKTNLPGSRTLAGATFELYAKTPTSASAAIASTIYRGAYYRVGTYTTDASGSIYVGDLPWDDYYFIETVAPDGYTINTDTNGDPIVYTFTISDTSTRTLSVDLGRITNTTTPPPTPPRGVRGERKPDSGRRSGGVLSGVLGVRAAPTAGVLGERVGPVTGDAANIALWLLLLIACVSTIVGILVSSRRRTRRAR